MTQLGSSSQCPVIRTYLNFVCSPSLPLMGLVPAAVITDTRTALAPGGVSTVIELFRCGT